jgi:hypothetical protein
VRPNLCGSQVAAARTNEAAFSALKRFQVVPPTLPRSVLEPMGLRLGLKATFPKRVPPKQAARASLLIGEATVIAQLGDDNNGGDNSNDHNDKNKHDDE